MVLVQMTEEEFLAKAAELLHVQGIAITGPVGKLTSAGVTAGYTHANGTLTVHIIDKPAFLSRVYCERRIEEWLAL